jgi:hypothetical protein
LKELLQPGFSFRRDWYNEPTRTARYLRSDGEMVVCYTVTGISRNEAIAIANGCAAETTWSAEMFDRVLFRALGVRSERVN